MTDMTSTNIKITIIIVAIIILTSIKNVQINNLRKRIVVLEKIEK